MVQVVFVKVIEKIRRLTENYAAYAGKAQEKDYEKLNGDSVLYGSNRMQKQRQAEA